MLSRIVSQSVRKLGHSSLRRVSTQKAAKLTDYRKSLVIAGFGSSLLGFDYFLRDGQGIQAFTRFFRSLKMGAEISFDYKVGLWGLDEESEEYDKVRKQHEFGEKFLISGIHR